MFSTNNMNLSAVTGTCDISRWYAVYTHPRHEKRAYEQLASRSVNCFLPLYRSTHRWNDRSRVVELPLLPGYLFIRIATQDRLQVLQAPGVVRILSVRGLPVPIPDHEVEQVRQFLDSNLRAEPHPYLRVGSRVRVKRGPLQGVEGNLVRWKNVCRLVISLHLLLRAIAVELEAADIEPIVGAEVV